MTREMSQGSGESSGRGGGRPTWAEIDLEALAANFRAVREAVGPDVRRMAIVKADAYGHGAVRCARRLAAEGTDWFGVALPEEGIELREAGIREPILILGGFWGAQAGALLRYELVPVIYTEEMAAALDRAAREAGTVARAHVKVDTGMGRLGVRGESVAAFARALTRLENLRVEGLTTHFAAADELERNEFTAAQIERFAAARRIFESLGYRFSYQHLANSAGTFAHRAAHGNMVRPGGVLYGLWRDVLPPLDAPPPFRPVMSLRSRITLLKKIGRGETLGYGQSFQAARETLVATLPLGYHDGYPRALSNRGRVLVRGQFAPVVGRVSMDLTLVDVTDVEGVALGDVATLIGRDGDLRLTAEEVAETAGTISYEITCGVSARVPRLYSPA